MLCVNNYPKQYIDECRSKFAAQTAAYQSLVAATDKQKSAGLGKALEEIEAHFFGNMLLALDGHFIHRARAKELKDGNPLNEARMLCNSMLNNGGVLCADKTIKYDPSKSVLNLCIGDTIKLSQKDFVRLSSAFLAEIEDKYL